MKFTIGDIDPIMPRFIWIGEDKYDGAYSHHEFTAWIYGIPIQRSDAPVCLNWAWGVPGDASAGDPTCEKFWRNRELPTFPIYGGGNTPLAAAKDLLSKVSKLAGLEASFLFNGVMMIINQYGNNAQPEFRMELIENGYVADECLEDAIQRLLITKK